MQGLPSPQPSGKEVWGKRILIFGVVALFVCGIGIYSQIDSMFNHTDPRLSGANEAVVDELAQFELGAGCQQAWVLPEMKDVEFSLQGMDGVEIDTSACVNDGSEGLEPMGKNGEVFIKIGEWDLAKGEYRALATCPEEAVNCEGNGTVWVVDRGAILEGFMGESLLLGSLFGCLCSLCLIPLGLTISVMGSNRKGAGGVMIIQGQNGEAITVQPKPETEQNLNSNDIDALNAMASRGVVLNTDQIYSLMHGTDETREKMLQNLHEIQRRSEVPDPFSSASTNKVVENAPTLIPDSDPLPDEPLSIDVVEEVVKESEGDDIGTEPEKGASWKSWDEG